MDHSHHGSTKNNIIKQVTKQQKQRRSHHEHCYDNLSRTSMPMSSDDNNDDHSCNGIECQPNNSQSGDIRIEGYVYRDRSHISPTQTDLEAMKRDKDTHHFAQRLPTKLNRMLQDPGKSCLAVISRSEVKAEDYFIHELSFCN